MLIKWINNNTEINDIDIDYLIRINDYFVQNSLIQKLEDCIYQLNTKLSNINDLDLFNRLVNNITSYVEGSISSAIEGLVHSNKKDEPTEINNHKITSYINQTREVINNNDAKVNEAILIQFHDAIEPNKHQGIRNNINQFIGDYKAPNSQNINKALSIFWKIYYGQAPYHDINIFVRWAYQHLLFETIHPFDDGNGRSGRMLNFFFFKNQSQDILNGLLIEISSRIFASKDMYCKLLADSRIKFKAQAYSSDITKSQAKDINFCEYLMNLLLEEINYLNEHIVLFNSLINKTQTILNQNKVLKRYSQRLIQFFSLNTIFTRKLLKDNLDLAEATSSKIMLTLQDLGLIEATNSISGIKNEQYKQFIPFIFMQQKNIDIDKLNNWLNK